jgi:hypothetical protein
VRQQVSKILTLAPMAKLAIGRIYECIGILGQKSNVGGEFGSMLYH